MRNTSPSIPTLGNEDTTDHMKSFLKKINELDKKRRENEKEEILNHKGIYIGRDDLVEIMKYIMVEIIPFIKQKNAEIYLTSYKKEFLDTLQDTKDDTIKRAIFEQYMTSCYVTLNKDKSIKESFINDKFLREEDNFLRVDLTKYVEQDNVVKEQCEV